MRPVKQRTHPVKKTALLNARGHRADGTSSSSVGLGVRHDIVLPSKELYMRVVGWCWLKLSCTLEFFGQQAATALLQNQPQINERMPLARERERLGRWKKLQHMAARAEVKPETGMSLPASAS